MIKITYEYPTAEGNRVQRSYICDTKEQAEHVCKMVENLVDNEYRLIDVTKE